MFTPIEKHRSSHDTLGGASKTESSFSTSVRLFLAVHYMQEKHKNRGFRFMKQRSSQ
jgi:hypothetical protein